MFNAHTGQLVHATMPSDTPYYISPDEQYLITRCSVTQENTVYTLATGNKIGTLPDSIELNTCTFCPCSSLVAFAEYSKDEKTKTIAVCSLPSGICLARLEGELRAFSPDDHSIVTGYSFLHNGKIQGSIKIYDAHIFNCIESIELELPAYLMGVTCKPEAYTIIIYFRGNLSPWIWDRKQQIIYLLSQSPYEMIHTYRLLSQSQNYLKI